MASKNFAKLMSSVDRVNMFVEEDCEDEEQEEIPETRLKEGISLR